MSVPPEREHERPVRRSGDSVDAPLPETAAGADHDRGPRHTFAALAEAIDATFARWDLGHLHRFELADERLLGMREAELGEEWLHDDAVKVAAAVRPGDEFVYTFDLGDEWRHRCTVLPDKVDPREKYGPPPQRPVPPWGWGWIPDQYGRETFEDLG